MNDISEEHQTEKTEAEVNQHPSLEQDKKKGVC